MKTPIRVSIASPIPSLATCGAINAKTIPVLFGSDGAGGVVGTVSNAKPGGRGPTATLELLQDHPDAARLAELIAKAPGCIKFVATDGNLDAIKVEVARRSTEFSAVGARAAAGAAAAGLRHVVKEGVKWPGALPPPLNGWKMTAKRAYRMNKPLIKRAAVDAAVVGTAVYAADRLSKKADDEKRRERLRRLSARLDNTIELNRRDPAINRLVDATGRNVVITPSELPYLETAQDTKKVLEKHPVLRRAVLKAAALAAGAGAGAYAGHRLHGASRRAYLKGGAIAGGLAATTLFESRMNSPEDLAHSITNQIDQAAGNDRAGRSETQSLSTLPQRLGISLDLVEHLLADGILKPERPLYADRWAGPLIFDSDHLNEVKRYVLAQVAADAIEGVDGDDDHLQAVAGQAVHDFTAKAAVTELATREDDGRYRSEPSVMTRVGKLVGGAALLGGAAYLRGRMGGLGKPGFRGIGATARAGGRQLLTDAKTGILGAKDAIAGAAPSALEKLRRAAMGQ